MKFRIKYKNALGLCVHKSLAAGEGRGGGNNTDTKSTPCGVARRDTAAKNIIQKKKQVASPKKSRRITVAPRVFHLATIKRRGSGGGGSRLM